MTLFRFSDFLVKRLRTEPGLAERLVEAPKEFGLGEGDVIDFNYREFDRILEGRPALSKALDQEHSPQVGFDFGYGPGWVFTSREAARLGKALVTEAAAAEGAIPEYVRDEFRRYAEFFVLAAQSQKSVLTIIS